MNKKIIITISSAVITLIVIVLISYVLTSSKINTNSDIEQEELSNITNEIEDSIGKDEYREINKDSELARELFNFVPKYLQNITDKMNNEYILYSALTRLEEKNYPHDTYTVEENEFPGYKSEDVQRIAKELYGQNIVIEKKTRYDLPIGYSPENDIFYKYPMGFGSTEEFQVIKELKENNNTYKLVIYALNVEYDINELNSIYIATRDTYKLYQKGETNDSVIRSSMRKYVVSGVDIDPTPITNEYKEQLPLIEYELEKLDDRGTKYFIKNIKYIIN